MIARKYTATVITILMAIAVCLSLTAVVFSGQLAEAVGDTGVTMEYESKLFDTETVMNVNIRMDEDEWADMLANASAEEYYACDVEINGQTFYRVGIRPKGNTSLSSIVSDPDSDRYSFKLEFDQYVDGQTCFGLDKLILNNNYADATNMKEALVYDMFRSLDVDAPLSNYAKISVNGEYWGIYLALEAVEDSFLLRNYGVRDGELYKPESMNIGGGGGGFSMGGGGANLNYSDDDLDSYSTIWEGEVTKTTEADHERVVTALKNIAEGTDLERYMDIDNLLRYMAVHIFAVNDDSLSGSMAHNYYLYESGGKLNIIPWDYNLSFGGMNGGSSGTNVVNEAIDDCFDSTDFFDTLMANEDYHGQYYAYLTELVENYVNGGGFDAFYTRVRSQIDALVSSDPTAFYSFEEYETAVEVLYQTVKLRGKSVAGQVAGTIPSTEAEQRNADTLVDGSSLNISAMGSMMGGGGNRGDKQAMGNFGGGKFGGSFDGQANGEMPTMPNGVDFTQTNGEAPQMPENFDSSQMGEMNGEVPQMPENFDFSQMKNNRSEDGAEGGEFNFSMPAMGNFPNMAMGGAESVPQWKDTLIFYGVCLGVLLAALLFATCYRRKPKRR